MHNLHVSSHRFEKSSEKTYHIVEKQKRLTIPSCNDVYYNTIYLSLSIYIPFYPWIGVTSLLPPRLFIYAQFWRNFRLKLDFTNSMASIYNCPLYFNPVKLGEIFKGTHKWESREEGTGSRLRRSTRSVVMSEKRETSLLFSNHSASGSGLGRKH